MYMLAQIAVTMALDLDLEKDTITGDRVKPSAELERTFLAAYQVCSSYKHLPHICNNLSN